jgi:hypothetical protein
MSFRYCSLHVLLVGLIDHMGDGIEEMNMHFVFYNIFYFSIKS